VYERENIKFRMKSQTSVSKETTWRLRKELLKQRGQAAALEHRQRAGGRRVVRDEARKTGRVHMMQPVQVQMFSVPNAKDSLKRAQTGRSLLPNTVNT
jgi:hypothetical protein